MSISGSNTNDEIAFNVTGSLRMRLDQQGNLGLNSVLPAINTNYRSININTTGFINGNSDSYFGSENNAYVAQMVIGSTGQMDVQFQLELICPMVILTQSVLLQELLVTTSLGLNH